MRFRIKKQGSSFIFVVIMFMFVIIVSTAMLSMVTGNYSARVSESKRVHNLYGAESGLDTAYNVAAKTVEKANIYAADCTKKFQEKVEEHQKESNWIGADNNIIIDIDGISTTFLRDDIKDLYALYSHIDYLKALEEDKSSEIETYNVYIDEFLNYIFKKSFKDYVDKNLYNNIVGNKNGNIQNGKINGEYVSYGEDVEITVDTGKEDKKLDWKNLKSTDVSENDLVVKYKYGDDGKIVKDITYGVKFSYINQNVDINIISNFKTDRDNASETLVGKNPREIQVTFSLTVPNYDEVSFKNSIFTNVKEIPGLTVGGNMIVDNSNVNVTGDIFVEGTTPVVTSIDRTYKKYDSGIKINSTNTGKNTINFNDNVYTRETFNIKNNVNVNIKGDLYAKNVYAGYTDDDNKNESTQNSKLTVNNPNDSYTQKVVVDNDLAIKAKNTEISIDNFYGISDINGQTGEGVERKSSSIIVNNQKSESTITIKNEAYIAGVAHINTDGEGYQTGESVAVKGNYKAYSVPQLENDQFEYHNPLQLLKPNESLPQGELDQKANHFFDYWKKEIITETNDKKAIAEGSMDCGGVIFLNPNSENIKSVGALVYKDKDVSKIAKPSFTIEDFNKDSIVKKLRQNYAKNIYKLINDDNKLSDDYLEKLYTGNDAEVQAETVQNNILNKFNLDYDSKRVVFSKNKSIVITKNESSYDQDKYKTIEGSSNLNRVIVTSKDVIIDGDVNFRGNIITSGNLEIKGNGTVNLYYDPTLTKDIQNENLSIFKQVFGDEYGGDDFENSGATSTSNGASFLKTKQWKIIK
ncbi:hypothetical protein [Clostridium sp. 3-3]|uniref:hypothetical protein n=1 Tax=Clostridium sp. 3-3 TaxID=2070757 RepID=UPI000CDB6174|nr:hypothetical protein [Clostridium sp. 3-3]POO86538.1 hypothetical protein C1H59_10150 [Clostridium sp. 3-3]